MPDFKASLKIVTNGKIMNTDKNTPEIKNNKIFTHSGSLIVLVLVMKNAPLPYGFEECWWW